jgi:hypothetical protein
MLGVLFLCLDDDTNSRTLTSVLFIFYQSFIAVILRVLSTLSTSTLTVIPDPLSHL